jgi:hypothetical protein
VYAGSGMDSPISMSVAFQVLQSTKPGREEHRVRLYPALRTARATSPQRAKSFESTSR